MRNKPNHSSKKRNVFVVTDVASSPSVRRRCELMFNSAMQPEVSNSNLEIIYLSYVLLVNIWHSNALKYMK
jgi:hypothetical protein